MSEKVVINLGGGEHVTFEDPVYRVEIPEPEPHYDAYGKPSFIQQTGTFSIKIPEFAGWFGAEGILIGEEYFEVRRLFKTPTQNGEWLVFPVGR